MNMRSWRTPSPLWLYGCRQELVDAPSHEAALTHAGCRVGRETQPDGGTLVTLIDWRFERIVLPRAVSAWSAATTTI